MKNQLFFAKRVLLCFSIFFICISSIHSQEDNQRVRGNFWQNVRFGGGFGLGFGNGNFSGTIAPSAIYDFNDQFALGLGLNAIFSKRRDFYKSTVLGGSVIALFNPIDVIQLSTEFEPLHVNRNFDEDFVSNADDKYWYSALFLGAGYRTGNVTIGIRYDVLYDEDKSIYADPWIPFFRVFF